MNPHLELDTYPLIKRWLETHQSEKGSIQDVSGNLLFRIALLLKSQEKTPLPWTRLLENLSCSPDSSNQEICQSIELAQSMNCDLMQVISHLTEETVIKGFGQEIYRHLNTLAHHSTVVGLKFLTAWTAFNIDRYKECLDHCEPIMDRFSHVYMLAGQAQMHLGEATAAIETLHIATILAPHDITGWFLLAKAYLITENLNQAVKAITTCIGLDSLDLECCFLALMIGSHAKCDQHSRLEIISLTEPTMIHEKVPIHCFLKYLEVLLIGGSREMLHQFLRKNIEKKFTYKLEQNYQAQNLSAILKILAQQTDYLGSQLLLECMCLN